MRKPFPPALYPLLLAALAVLVLAPGIWEATGITGKDEFFLGLRTPMEMMASDHWLVPFLDGAPRIRKPPLLYWLGRGSFELFGVSLASARIVGVLFAALLVAATVGIGRRLSRDARTGLVAGAILLGCLGLHSEGRRFMLDVPVAALSAAAFWSFLVWLQGPLASSATTPRRWPWLTLSTFLLAAGFLVKGPVVGLVCGGGIVALFLAQQLTPADLRRHAGVLTAHALLLALLAVPWFLIVKARYPLAAELTFADEMESRRLLTLSPEILPGLLNVALPWGFVFLAALWLHRRRDGTPRLAAIWFLASFLPFLFLRSFDRYLIGSLVPLSIFLALALPELRARWAFRLGAVVATLFGSALALFAWRFHLDGWFWLPPAAIYLLWSWWQERALTHALAAPIVFGLILLWGVFPALGVNAVPKNVVELGKARAIAFYQGPQPAMLPILNARPHRHYARIDATAAADLAGKRALIFAESSAVAGLQNELSAAGYRAVAAGHYRALASHGSGLRFARVGATLADWQAAWASHRLDRLTTEIVWFEIVPR